MWNLERVPRPPDRVHWIVVVLVENMRLCSRQTANNPSFLFRGRARVASPRVHTQCCSAPVSRPVAAFSESRSPCDDLPTSSSVFALLDFCFNFHASLSWKPGVSPPRRSGPRFLDLPARFPKVESAYLSQLSIR